MSTASPTQHKDRVKTLLDGVAAGDIASFWEAMHPDVVLHEPPHLPYGGTYRGIEEFKRCFSPLVEVIDPGAIELVDLIVDGDIVVPLMKSKLVESGDDMYVMERWRLEDGKIREIRVFWFDTLPAA